MRRKSEVVFFCIVLSLLLSSAVAIADDAAAPDTNETAATPSEETTDTKDAEAATVEEITVTGKRMPDDPFFSDRSLTVVNANTLGRKSPRSTPEALLGSEGVFVQHTNHGGGSPIIRGMVGPQVLIMVDGVRMNNSIYRTGPLQYLNMIDPFSIDRIEVLRGPGGVLYGSDAMGGVIQLFTADMPDYRKVEGLGSGAGMQLRYASANQGLGGHGRVELGGGGFSFRGGFSYRGFQDLRGGRDMGVQPYTSYQHASGLGGLEYRFSDGFFKGSWVKAGYMANYMMDVGRAERLYTHNEARFYDNDDHLAYLKTHLKFRPLHTDLDLVLSYQHFFERLDDHTLDNPVDRNIVSSIRDEVTVNTVGVDAQFTTRVLDNRLRFNYGGMYYHDFIGAERFTRPQLGMWAPAELTPFPDGSTYGTFGLYLYAEGDVLRTDAGHILRLSAGYRFHGADALAPANGSMPETDFLLFGHVFHAGLQYIFSKHLSAAFTFSQGFRAPNLQETVHVGDTGEYYHIPNDNLDPERSDTLELSLRGSVWRLRASWSGYITMVHGIIKREATTYKGQETFESKDVVHNVNAGEAMLWGSEAKLMLDVGYGFSLGGGLTYTWGEESIDDAPDMPLSKIPPLFGSVNLRYDTKPGDVWTGYAEVYVRAAGKQDRLSASDEKDVRIPDGGTPGWWTLNFRAGVELYKRWQLGLSVENLLDETYKYHASGVYSPGVNAILTTRLSY